MLISKVYYPEEQIVQHFDTPMEDEQVWRSFRERFSELATRGYFQILEEGTMLIGRVPKREKREGALSMADVLAANADIADIEWEV